MRGMRKPNTVTKSNGCSPVRSRNEKSSRRATVTSRSEQGTEDAGTHDSFLPVSEMKSVSRLGRSMRMSWTISPRASACASTAEMASATFAGKDAQQRAARLRRG